VICRYQQYETTNKMIARVVAGYPKKGLIWHFQGSGKSLLMVFAAQKLRMHPKLGNPTVHDRGGPHRPRHADQRHLQRGGRAEHGRRGRPAGTATLLNQDVRKVLITTIHKFGEARASWNARKNIIVMVDEAHRTQEGDLGRKMREALPNAFLFGLTGTPINRADRNTFWAFGADEDERGLHEPLLVPGIHPRQGHAAAAL
jgi:type I restriction enzyme R subunit